MMNTIQIIYLALIFAAVFLVVLVILLQTSPSPLQTRLQQFTESDAKKSGEPNWVSRVVALTGPLARLSQPAEGWENSQLRTRFINAGYRSANAPILFFAAKTLLAVALPGLMLIYFTIAVSALKPNIILVLLLVMAAFGYLLPNGILGRKIFTRKREIFESLPDAIDLVTVCVEAGLGLDAAIARVGEEIFMKSPILGEELHLVNLELRAGSSRERALRNLALRTGVEEIDALVAMLVQADRFGTSVADSLRVYSDGLRTKRRLRAEEAAAKIATKLLFPLIFFIFPSLLLVLLGPAMIAIHRVLLPTLGGQ